MPTCTHGCLLHSHHPSERPDLVILSSLHVPRPKSAWHHPPRTPQGAFAPEHSSVARDSIQTRGGLSGVIFSFKQLACGDSKHRAEEWVPGALGMVNAGWPTLPTSTDQYPVWGGELLHQERELCC